jgi:hypothetical protein
VNTKINNTSCELFNKQQEILLTLAIHPSTFFISDTLVHGKKCKRFQTYQMKIPTFSNKTDRTPCPVMVHAIISVYERTNNLFVAFFHNIYHLK